MKIEVDCPCCGKKLEVRCVALDMLGHRYYEAKEVKADKAEKADK